jgi:uncharacterized surface protein with fasciclin (FAS1) repeats
MNLSKLLAAAALTAGLSVTALPAFAQAPELAEQAPAAAAPAAAIDVKPSGDIIQTLTASGQFTTLLKALDAVNLTSVLKTPGPLTLFAPTDAAFAAAPAGLVDLNNKTALQQLLVYHIINAKVDDSKIKGAKGPIPSAAGKPIYVDGSATPAKANDATILTDVTVSNGVIHVVDKVLSPSFTPPPAAQ